MADERVRALMDAYGDSINEWQGVPVPLMDLKLRLRPGHPLAEKTAAAEAILHAADSAPAAPEPADGDPFTVINHWFSRRANRWVYLTRDAAGRYRAVREPVSAGQCMDRLTYWLKTLGATPAWTLNAEATALDKLEGLITGHQMRQYLLAGAFLETSSRSGVTYLFRRLRPTVAMTSRNGDPGNDRMRCLAALCLHPIGYYEGTWAGAMVPTDDLIAHLMLMRADEAGFWRQASQHPPWTPEAGILLLALTFHARMLRGPVSEYLMVAKIAVPLCAFRAYIRRQFVHATVPIIGFTPLDLPFQRELRRPRVRLATPVLTQHFRAGLAAC